MPDADGFDGVLGPKEAQPPTISPLLGSKDIALISGAVSQRWKIPQTLRDRLGEEFAEMILNKNVHPRRRISAAGVLLRADTLNLEQEKRDLGGETLNVNLQGQLAHQHEHSIRGECAEFLREYDAEMARSAGLPGSVSSSPPQSMDATAANGQANNLSGNGQH